MATQRLSDQVKKDRGTFERSRSEAVLIRGRVALTEALPPPSGMGAAARKYWKILMMQAVASRTIAPTNLVAFGAMCEAAAARELAYKAAVKAGPTTATANGTIKTSPAWTAFVLTDRVYLRWLESFGLTPKSGSGVSVLPVPRPRLTAVS